MLGGSASNLSDYWVGQAVSKSVAADLARHEWKQPVGNAAVSVGLLSLYLGAIWARTLPDGAGSSRVAAFGMVALGVIAIVVGHQLRRRWKAQVASVIAQLQQ